MAEATPGFAEAIQSLPGPLQVVLMLGAGAAMFFMLWRKLMSSLKGEGPESREMVVGGPTTFADLSPIRDLVKAVEVLTQQEIKTEAAILTAAAGLTSVSAQAAEYFKHLQEDRERRETGVELQGLLKDLRLAELEERLKARIKRRPARRPPAVKKPPPTTTE